MRIQLYWKNITQTTVAIQFIDVWVITCNLEVSLLKSVWSPYNPYSLSLITETVMWLLCCTVGIVSHELILMICCASLEIFEATTAVLTCTFSESLCEWQMTTNLMLVSNLVTTNEVPYKSWNRGQSYYPAVCRHSTNPFLLIYFI